MPRESAPGSPPWEKAFLHIAVALFDNPKNAPGLSRRPPNLAPPPAALELVRAHALSRTLQLLVLTLANRRGLLPSSMLRRPPNPDRVARQFGLFLPPRVAAAPSLEVPPAAWTAAAQFLASPTATYEPDDLRQLGDAYQTLLQLRLVRGATQAAGLQTVVETSARKANGAYFTPEPLVDRLVRKTLAPLLQRCDRDAASVLDLRIVDPAMGAGLFLLNVINVVAAHLVVHCDGIPEPAHPAAPHWLSRSPDSPFERALQARRQQVAQSCVYGVDEDPTAVALARATIWLHASSPAAPVRGLAQRLQRGNALVGATLEPASQLPPGPAARSASLRAWRKRADRWCATWFGSAEPEPEHEHEHEHEHDGEMSTLGFHWQLAFPEVAFAPDGSLKPGFGFDAVVGNPPWDRIRPEKRSFYAAHTHLPEGGTVDLAGSQGASLDSLISGLHRARPGLARDWTRYRDSLGRFARFLRESKTYRFQQDSSERMGNSDPDLYRYFVERAFQCVRTGGRVGLVVPAALWQAEGCTGLRRLLLHEATLDELAVFENHRKWAFDIDSRFKFSVFVATASPAAEGHSFPAAFMLPSLASWNTVDARRQIRLSASMAERLSPGTSALLDLRSPGDARIVEELYRRYPLLGEPGSGWVFRFSRELDITTDARWFRHADWMKARGFTLFRATRNARGEWAQVREGPTAPGHPWPGVSRPGGDCWVAAPASWYRQHGYLERRTGAGARGEAEFIHPDDLPSCANEPAKRGEDRFRIRPAAVYTPLYEGRLVHHFDHASKAWLSGEGPRALWEPLAIRDKSIRPRVFVSPSLLGNPAPCRIAFGAVASATNERSCLAALLPDDCLAGNSTPTLALRTREEALLLLCVLCSFVFDYLVRLRTTTNINWTQLSRIAVPRLDSVSPTDRRELVHAATRLSCTTPELAPVWNAIFPALPWSYDSAERDPWRRAELRARVDSIVASLYGLGAPDYAVILSSFPLLDRDQPALDGDLFIAAPRDSNGALPAPPRQGSRSLQPVARSFVTRDLALLVHLQRTGTTVPAQLEQFYRDDAGHDPNGPHSRFRIGRIKDLQERVLAARALGAVAYLPPRR